MIRRRVKITGIGPVTPAGIGREAFWQGIQEPVSRIQRFEKLGEEWGDFIAGVVDDDELKRISNEIGAEYPRHLARHSWFGAAASARAVNDAGLDLEELRKMTVALVVGTSVMDFGGITQSIRSVARRGLRGIKPRVVETANVTHVATCISKTLQISGFMQSVQSSCCSGVDAIGMAADLIALGEADVAICGGSESPLFLHPMLEFRAAELTPATIERAESHCRPFDMWRSTGTISEGASMVILEPEESPRPGYAFVSGHSFFSDRSGELCSGFTKSILGALADAGIRKDQVEAISASGPGHFKVDAAESKALDEVFGQGLESIASYSIKGAIGNALGGAPAIQVAAAALGLKFGLIPPTVNWSYPDPTVHLNLSGEVRRIEHEHTIINAHGMGGENATLVLSK